MPCRRYSASRNNRLSETCCLPNFASRIFINYFLKMIIPIRNRCSFKITALVFIFFVESGSPASALRDSMGVRGGRGD